VQEAPWARSLTCLLNKLSARIWTPAPICSPSARSSMKWQPVRRLFEGPPPLPFPNPFLTKPVPAALRLNPDLPAELERIINKALEKDLDLRYQSASDLRTDFKRLKRETESGKSAAASPVAPSPAAWTMRFGYVRAALLLVAVMILAIGFFWIRSPLPPPRVLSITQLTHDNVPKNTVVTDGP